MARRPRFAPATTPTAPPSAQAISAHLVDLGDTIADGPPCLAVFDMLADAQALAPRSPVVSLYEALLLPEPDAYRPHVGDMCPTAPADLVAVLLEPDGAPLVDRADRLAWGAGLGPDGEGRVLRWAPALGR